MAVGGPQVVPTPGLRARFIWFVLPGPGRTLTICEVQAWQKRPWVWRQLSGLYNAAQFGTASASSTLNGWGDGLALRAVDGLAANQLDNAQPFTYSHTTSNEVPGPWWQVDMGEVVSVQYINVFGRNDCCQGRNQGMKVRPAFRACPSRAPPSLLSCAGQRPDPSASTRSPPPSVLVLLPSLLLHSGRLATALTGSTASSAQTRPPASRRPATRWPPRPAPPLRAATCRA
jgi:hypothetical protein